MKRSKFYITKRANNKKGYYFEQVSGYTETINGEEYGFRKLMDGRWEATLLRVGMLVTWDKTRSELAERIQRMNLSKENNDALIERDPLNKRIVKDLEFMYQGYGYSGEEDTQ